MAINVVACGSSSDEGSNSGQSLKGGPGSHGAAGDGGPGGQNGSGGERPKVGKIHVENTKATIRSRAVQNYLASVLFSDRANLQPKCEAVPDGQCTVYTCTGSISGDQNNVHIYRGGIVRIAGTAVSPAIQLEPGAGPLEYSPVSGNVSLWSGGESIQVTGTGDPNGAPAFAQTLKAPSLITLSSPTWTRREGGPTIDRSKNLELAWNVAGAASGTVALFLGGPDSAEKFSFAQCAFPVADLKGTVPASVLGKLPAGQGEFTVDAEETSVVPAGSDWDIEVSLASTGALADGLATGDATFR
ncbi:hypothetical protein [Pendulispora albinea]|uniref:Uncharacterized protein n=1 Tax=Pendulispora albinea TaxID=2741071 RepID=A0ABZ2LXU8_9BACT